MLVLALGVSLFGFNPVRVSAQELTGSAVSDLDITKVAKKERTPDISSDEVSLAESDPNRMVRVIVELTADSIAETATKSNKRVADLGAGKIASLESSILEGQNKVKSLLGKKVKLQDRLSGEKAAGEQLTTTINGFSTYMRLGDLALAESTQGVAKVYLANEYYRPAMSTSVNMIHAPEAWSTYNMEGEGTIVAIIDSGVDPDHKDMRLDDTTVPALNESDVASSGLPGIYFTEKIPYGYNYYDLNTNIKDHADSQNHGMHVAGTVAANGEIKGVAPEAQLLAMKVFSDDILYATTFSDIYLRAMDDAVKLGADAVNMSLGSPAGFYVPDSIEDQAVNRARANGVTVAIAGGNEHNMMNGAGKTNQAKNPDNGVVGSPSVNEGALSVASVENSHILGNQILYTIDGAEASAILLPAPGSPLPWTVYTAPMELADAGFGFAEDFAGRDLTGKIALVERGKNTFLDMLARSVAAKAAGLLVFNSAAGGEGTISMVGGETAAIPYMFTVRSAGLAMKAALAEGKTLTVSFPETKILFGNPAGGYLSSFSSWGTPPDLTMKPEISAPGGMIYSTQNDNGYSVMSGTSMATPHVAGASALAAQRLDDDPLFSGITLEEKSGLVKTLLMNTAVPYKDSRGLYYDTRQQGAGLINVARALESPVVVTDTATGEPKVELFDFNTAYFDVGLTLKNYSNTDRIFKTDSILLTDDYVSDGKGHFTAAERTQAVSHTTSGPRQVIVPANGSIAVKFRINFAQYLGNNPTNSLTQNQYLGGFIRFLALDAAGSDLTVPVLGFYGDWDAPKVLDESRWNLQDNQASNDPEFPYTTLVHSSDSELFFADTRSDLWINPESKQSLKSVYGTDSVALLGTLLRNAGKITYRVKDGGGKTLRTVGMTGYASKINRLAQGRAPYRYFSESRWDGKVAGRTFAEGEKVFYEIEVQRTADSAPQVYSFPVRFDNAGPVISNLNFDPVKQTLSLDLADAGSGLDSVEIYSEDFTEYVSAAYAGSKTLTLDVSSLRKETAATVYIIGYDAILNYSVIAVTLPGTGVKTESTVPDPATTPVSTTPAIDPGTTIPERLDDAYGKPQIVLYSPDLLYAYKNPVSFKGVVYGWENISRATASVNGKEIDLNLTRHDKSSALDPEGNELFFGTTWTFDETLKLPDGYFELPLRIYNGDETAEVKTFNIVRRFWVDNTPPVIEASYKLNKGRTATIELKATDNLFYLEIYQGDSLLSSDSWEDRGFGTSNISITHTIPVTLQKGTNSYTFSAYDSAGNLTVYSLEIPGR